MSKPPRTDVVTVFIMNDGRYVKEHEFDRLKAELDAAWAKIEELNKDYAAFSAKSEMVCVEYANKIAEKDKTIEQMREIMAAVASIAGKNWLWGQLALGEMLDGKSGPHCEWALGVRNSLLEAERANNGKNN